MNIEQLDQRTTNMQIQHNLLKNKVAVYSKEVGGLKDEIANLRVKNRAEHASFESNINLLVRQNKKLTEDLEEVMTDRNAMALVVDNFEEKVNKVQPKKSLFNRIFK
jgi:hypothetical protein